MLKLPSNPIKEKLVSFTVSIVLDALKNTKGNPNLSAPEKFPLTVVVAKVKAKNMVIATKDVIDMFLFIEFCLKTG